ncbi:MAG: rubrerythrin domain protein [Acidobacteria bacterium]|nr:rubrerythrin domain protein [Acidobacteriota bacterium]
MKLDNAIRTALEYETGVYRIYLEAMEKTSDRAAKRVFKVLCDEEMGHLKYLQARLEEWQKTGKVRVRKLGTTIPAREAIDKGLQDLRKTVKPKRTRQILELELLKKALDAEIKSSNFYKEMVGKLDGEGQELFKRFVEIEDGHVAIVSAEINTVGNWGFWFDTPEFRLEME